MIARCALLEVLKVKLTAHVADRMIGSKMRRSMIPRMGFFLSVLASITQKKTPSLGMFVVVRNGRFQ